MAMPRPDRIAEVTTIVPDAHSVDLRAFLDRLSALSARGLARMYAPRSRSFPQTVRQRGHDGPPQPEGMSVRYTAIATLGLTRLDRATRQAVLAGDDVGDLLPAVLGLALAGRDPGAVALSLWAASEMPYAAHDAVAAEAERVARAVDRLLTGVRTEAPIPTVDQAWSLVALLGVARDDMLAEAAGGRAQLVDAAQLVARRLLAAQGETGLFPHHLPAEHLSRLRSHVGCFADQVYPIQALARYADAMGDQRALEAASRCADRIVELQGVGGQWWWHYDWRHGTVVEGYPVYSVHQHAMAPMALMELREAGGSDHRPAVAAGLDWLRRHPESEDELVADDLAVIWRKVGRREPRKAVRRLRSAASSGEAGVRMSWLDQVFPPGAVDHECRPYELGWLLYAWHSGPAAEIRPSEGDGVVLTLPRPRIDPPRGGEADLSARMYGLTVDALTMDEVVTRCRDALHRRERMLIGVLNAAKVVSLGRDERLRESLLECDLLLADGQSVVWASRLIGGRPLPERVAGIDLFERLLQLAEQERAGVYLLGAKPEVLATLRQRLRDQYPGLVIAGAHDGYFSADEAADVAADIAASGAQLLFLGMTSPKKEVFLKEFGPRLGVPIMHGVGGSFDVFAGVTRRAPLAWQRAGMEWAYRLVQEPGRLWRRYLTTNSAFVLRTVRERVRPTPAYPSPAAGDLVIDLRDNRQPSRLSPDGRSSTPVSRAWS
jgi:exopolysaccharide biosynthesis WecB/TagA/CpsF family protein